jgi:hypothetical protein
MTVPEIICKAIEMYVRKCSKVDALAMTWRAAGDTITNVDPTPEMIVNQLITVTDFGRGGATS